MLLLPVTAQLPVAVYCVHCTVYILVEQPFAWPYSHSLSRLTLTLKTLTQ